MLKFFLRSIFVGLSALRPLTGFVVQDKDHYIHNDVVTLLSNFKSPESFLQNIQNRLQSPSGRRKNETIDKGLVSAPDTVAYLGDNIEVKEAFVKCVRRRNGLGNIVNNQKYHNIKTGMHATMAFGDDRDNRKSQQNFRNAEEEEEEEEEDGGNNSQTNASQTLKYTFAIYLPLLVIFFTLFCLLRKKFPQTYNVRNNVPELQCELAKEQYGLVSWIWNMFKQVTEEELLEQCGMDAVCFLRVLDMGLKLSAMGIVLSFVLIPVYKTAPSAEDTADITDTVVQITVANVPAGSSLLLLTTTAAYILIGYAMHLALEELKWYARCRSKFLSRPDIRNYTVYVSGIPQKYCSDEELANFFRRIFSADCVVDACVALNVPKLESKVSERENVLFNLEHAINIQQLTGVAPTHLNADIPGGQIQYVDSIAYYRNELDVLNKEIRGLIEMIQRNVTVDVADRGGDLEAPGEDGDLEQEDPLASHDYASSSLQRRQKIFSKDLVDSKASLDTRQASASLDTLRASASFDTLRASESLDTVGASPAVWENPENNLVIKALNVTKDIVSKTGEQTKDLVTKTGEQTKELVAKTSELIGLDGVEDGTPLDAGFVTFTKLSTASAAKQMVHSITPFEMEISDAPDPNFIVWSNVGKTRSSIEVGKTVSRILTTALCLFWTLPVSFIVSWTEVESLKEELEFLNDWIEAAPVLEPLLAQISPMVLLFLNTIVLPTTLRIISKWEGLVGDSFLEWALFKKLAGFAIIQTFFVASLAGSVTSGISEVLEGPTELLTFLATHLPPQSTFYIQLITTSTIMGLGFEMLRTTALMKHFARKFVGPRFSEKERNMVFIALRPLSNPREFLHAQVLAYTSLSFMVIFVYAITAPLVCYVLILCFLALRTGYRHQFIYIYPPKPDSGGKLWVSFIFVYVLCAIVAELTLLGYLGLKKSPAAVPFMIILLIITVRFLNYIQQRHFRVANHVSSEECHLVDVSSNGGLDFQSMKGVYRQPCLNPEELHPENMAEEIVLSSSG